jgi:hypothetical protein
LVSRASRTATPPSALEADPRVGAAVAVGVALLVRDVARRVEALRDAAL